MTPTLKQLLGLAHHMLKSYSGLSFEDRQDIAQEAVVKYWERRDNVEHPAPYVKMVARNMVVDKWRRENSRKKRLANQDAKLHSFQPNWEAEIDRSLDAEADWAVFLSQLSDKQRELLEVFWDGIEFSPSGQIAGGQYEYAAREMGVSYGAVKSTWHRIKQKAHLLQIDMD